MFREQGPSWAHLLSDLQSSLTQRLGFFVLPSFAVKHREVVQSCCHLPTEGTRKNGKRHSRGDVRRHTHTHARDPQCVTEVLSSRWRTVTPHRGERATSLSTVGHKVTPQIINKSASTWSWFFFFEFHLEATKPTKIDLYANVTKF